MSGHSKFANIKHKKERNDAAKGKIFTIIGRELAVAVKEGGPDPNNNSRLRDVIAKAKANNMPNDTIDRGIKRAAGDAGSVNYEHVTYEGYGPGGVAIIVEALLVYVNVAYELYQDSRLTIFMLGGELRSNSLTLTGPIAQTNLKQFQLSKAFLSVNAIDEKGNLYTDSVVESGLLETLFSIVEEVYVLCDSSKLNSRDFISISHEQSYTLITDQDADESLLEAYRQCGIRVVKAAPQI